MKFTQKQLIDFALKAGVPVVEVVAEEKEADYNEDSALQAVHAAVTPILKPKFEADLTDGIETKLKGKHAGEMYSLLARESGLTRAELEKMKVDDAAKHAFTHIQSKLGGDTAALQQEIKDLMAKQVKAIATVEADRDTKVSEANQKYINRDIKAYLAESVVGKAPLLESANKEYYAELLMKHLQDKYHLNYDEAKKAVAPFKKDNHAVPALNEAGTAVIDFMKEFETLAKPAGVWKTDQRDINPAAQMGKQKQEQYGKQSQQQTEGRRANRANRPTAEQIVNKMKELEGQTA